MLRNDLHLVPPQKDMEAYKETCAIKNTVFIDVRVLQTVYQLAWRTSKKPKPYKKGQNCTAKDLGTKIDH